MPSANTGLAPRHYFIDALRVIAIGLMFVFHVSMIFAAESPWHIKNEEQSRVLLEVNYFLSFFRMPLLFLVSGYISALLLTRLSWGNFINQRAQRLLIPLVVWTFILVAPQIYFERKLAGGTVSYSEFYTTFLQFKLYPEGNFHWLHLWFIPYLFVYNLVSIPIFYLLNAFNSTTKTQLSKGRWMWGVCSFVVLACLPHALLTVHFPATHDLVQDYARHCLYLPFVIAGLLLYRFGHWVDAIEQNRRAIARLAFAITLLIFTLRWNDWDPFHIWPDWRERPQTYLYLTLLNVHAWAWVMAFLGYGKRYLNAENRFFNYANQAVYPFYILHQTIIVTLGYYVVRTADNAAFKYLFILFVSLWLCLCIYHFFIRPFLFMRYLFGSK